MSEDGNVLDNFGTDVKKAKEAYNDRDVIESLPPLNGSGAETATTTKQNGFCQWSIVCENKEYVASQKTTDFLPAGYYDLYEDNQGNIHYTRSELITDNLLIFPDSILKDVVDEIDQFWTLAEKFKKYGFLHKRGYMFFGAAGTGKTSLVQLIIKNLIDNDGIIINGNVHPLILGKAIKIFREVEPGRKIICLFEDIDAIVHVWGEERILAILDGEVNINYVLNLATTNYPEKLDRRIVGRPRRFDRIIKVGNPSEEMRNVFFKEKLKIDGEELKKYVEATKDFTFAAMTELVISSKCLGNSFEDSINKIKEILLAKYSSDDYYTNKTGFGEE